MKTTRWFLLSCLVILTTVTLTESFQMLPPNVGDAPITPLTLRQNRPNVAQQPELPMKRSVKEQGQQSQLHRSSAPPTILFNKPTTSSPTTSKSDVDSSQVDASPPPPPPPTSHDKLTLTAEREATDGAAAFHYWVMSLGLTLVLALQYLLHRGHMGDYISESGAIILLGIIFAWFVSKADAIFSGPDDTLAIAVKFDHSFFTRFVLPTILFEQGYNMNHKGLVENVEMVFLLAVPGVVVAAILTGFGLFLGSSLTFPLLFLYPGGFFLCLAFGALLSATDPVAIVSILRAKFDVVGNPPTIYNIVAGESMLNDAMSIVLFDVAMDFVNAPLTTESAASATWHFATILILSVICGYAHGVLGLMIHRFLRFPGAPHLEVLVSLLQAASSYYSCEYFGLSGIMSLFVTARTLGNYKERYLTPDALLHAPMVFKSLSAIAEMASFFLIGTAFYAYVQKWNIPFCLLVMGLCFVVRWVVVSSSVRAANVARPRKLTYAAQIFVWYSGIRGAVCFGLVTMMEEHCAVIGVPEEIANVMLSATLWMIVFSVLVQGGAASFVLKKLRLEREDAAVEYWHVEDAAGNGGSQQDGSPRMGPSTVGNTNGVPPSQQQQQQQSAFVDSSTSSSSSAKAAGRLSVALRKAVVAVGELERLIVVPIVGGGTGT